MKKTLFVLAVAMMTTLLFSCSDEAKIDMAFKTLAKLSNVGSDDVTFEYKNKTFYRKEKVDQATFNRIKECLNDNECKTNTINNIIAVYSEASLNGDNYAPTTLNSLYNSNRKYHEVFVCEESGEEVELEVPTDWTVGLEYHEGNPDSAAAYVIVDDRNVNNFFKQ